MSARRQRGQSPLARVPDRRLDPEERNRLEPLVAAVAAPAMPGPQAGEAAALAAFRELTGAGRNVLPLTAPRRQRRGRAAAIGGAGLIVLLSGGVAAAAGALPTTAQSAAHDFFGGLGLHVPAAAHAARAAHPAHPAALERRPGLPLDALRVGPAATPRADDQAGPGDLPWLFPSRGSSPTPRATQHPRAAAASAAAPQATPGRTTASAASAHRHARTTGPASRSRSGPRAAARAPHAGL